MRKRGRPEPGDAVLFAALERLNAADGVRVRDVSRLPGLAGYLRVTIGTSTDNDVFLAALGRALDTVVG